MNYRTPIEEMRADYPRKRALVEGRPRPPHDPTTGSTNLLSVGVPVVLLHGVGGSGGYTDEIITFGLLGGLVVGLTFLSFRGARNKKKKGRSRNRRGRNR